MKKKIIALALCVITISTAFLGCGKSEDKETEKVSKTHEKSEVKSDKKSEEKEEEIKFLWEKGQKADFSYDFTVDECENGYRIENDNTEGDLKIYYEGSTNFLTRLFLSDELPDGIIDIKTSDVNFDGFTDIIILGYKDDKLYPWVFLGEENLAYSEEEPDCTVFYVRDYISGAIISYFGESYTSTDIIEYLTNGKKNGEFNDYQEAYKSVINFWESISPGEKNYDLIYFDEDSVPELVVDNTGYGMTMYTFKDGKLNAPMVDWAYGAGGNHGYEYSEYNNCIRNYNTDYAGAIMYISFATIMDNKLVWNYSIVDTFFDDKNGNGSPDEDEYCDEGPVDTTYECYTDDISEAELEAEAERLDGLNYEEMYGSKSASQIMEELGVPAYEVTRIDKKSFKSLGKSYSIEQKEDKSGKLKVTLSEGKNSVESTYSGDSAKFYLFERPDDKAYLYMFVRDDDQSNLYIYNLNLSYLNEPKEFDSDFSLYNGDITDASEFMLQAHNDVLVDTAVQQSFCISEAGDPIAKDINAYFITKDSLEDGAKISDKGDKIIITKDFSCYSTKNLDDNYVYGDEPTEFKSGEEFYLYRFVYQFGFSYDIYLVNEDGDMIQFEMFSKDGIIDKSRSLIGFGGELYVTDLKLAE